MILHRIQREQFLPVGLAQAWDFFSSPANLDQITPRDLGFEITGGLEARTREGQIITYRVRIAPGVKVAWVTEIKSVIEGRQFVDEQRFGPYKFWHHLHTFEEVEGGVRMRDLVHYALPFAWIGEVAHRLFVRDKLQGIFNFRKQKLEELFGQPGGSGC